MGCSKFWKLDKIDKIVISLTFIVVSFFSFFNCFCFASEDIEIPYSTLNGFSWSNDSIVQNENYYIKYWKVYPGSGYYLIKNFSSGGRVFNISTDLNLGTNPLSTFTVVHYDTNPFVLDLSEYQDDYSVLYLSYPVPYDDTNDYNKTYLYSSSSSMNLALGYLSDTVGNSQIFDIFENSLPYVFIIVLVAFGFYLITKVITGLSKGKGRV